MHRIRSWAHDQAHAHKSRHGNDKTEPSPSDSDANGQPIAEPTPLTNNSQENTIGTATEEKQKAPVAKRFWVVLKKTILSSWVNVLLVFVPAGIAVHFANIDPTVVFCLNAIAIIPLAGLLSYATESVAHSVGDTLGALLNVSFGNAVELIIFIIALVKNEIRVVQASLLGSILANLLLILGMCFLIGGLQYREQIYNSTVTQMSACLLCLAVMSLLLPTAFHASFSDADRADKAVLQVSHGTSVILLLVYGLYLLFQLKSHSYMYKSTPQHIIDEESHPGILQRMNTTSSTSSSSSSSSSSSNSSNSTRTHGVRRKLGRKLGRRRHTKTEEEIISPADGPSETLTVKKADTDPTAKKSKKSKKNIDSEPLQSTGVQPISDDALLQNPVRRPLAARNFSVRPPPVFRRDFGAAPPTVARSMSVPDIPELRRTRSLPTSSVLTGSARITGHAQYAVPAKGEAEEKEEPPLSMTASILLLLCSTGLVALCAEFLVGSIDHMVSSTPLSEAFIGLIILPIVGNAAEHVTAVTVAARNKMDLAIGVSVGSSIQIAIFVTPLVVIIGWIMDKDMSLYFNLFEVVTLFASTFIVNFLVLDGRSNYLEGALLCAAYIVIAIGAYFFPDEEEQATSTSGSAERRQVIAAVASAVTGIPLE